MLWCLTLLFLFVATVADARPPPGPDPDPAVSLWFRTLRRDSDNFPCCDVSDCRKVEEHKMEDGHYVVLAKREDFTMTPTDREAWDSRWPGQTEVWLTIPRGNITIRTDNPTGSAILCYSAMTNIIYCYVPWDYTY